MVAQNAQTENDVNLDTAVASKNTPEVEAKIALQRSLKQKGNDCLQANNVKGFKEACEIYTQALDEGEHDLELTSQLLSNRSHVNLMLRKNVEAVDDARNAIRANPRNIKPYWRAGRASMGLELYEQAKQFCQDGLKIDKNNSELKSLQVQCNKKLAEQMKAKKGIDCTAAEAQDQQDKVNELTEKTMILHNQVQMNERSARSAQLTLNSLQAVPEDVKLFKPVGRAFLGTTREQFSKDTQKEIAKLNSDTPKIRNNRDEMAKRKVNAEKEFGEMMIGLNRRKQEGKSLDK
eukprot:gene689-734_t